MANFQRLERLALEHGARVLVREDLNVPMEQGRIRSTARIDAALPTLTYALKKGARVLVASHLGRPAEGVHDPAFSLAPLAPVLAEKLSCTVHFIADINDTAAIEKVRAGEIGLLENVRFLVGETANDAALSQQLAALCDVFVMDAFATAHRAHASTCGVATYAKTACVGHLLAKELDALKAALADPSRPLVAVVGGAKVASKLGVLENLVERVDVLVAGGGIANTFLAASGAEVGASLVDADNLDMAKTFASRLAARGARLITMTDAVVAKRLEKDATTEIKPVNALTADDAIFDIGPASRALLPDIMNTAGTIVWNGPLGVFEYEAFAEGTRALAASIASSPAFSVAGGGDTVAAIEAFGIADKINYISTAGGAFLEWLAGDTLPGIAALERRA